jgi:hypothetical protein
MFPDSLLLPELPPGVRECAPFQIDVLLLVFADDVAALALYHIAVVNGQILGNSGWPEVANLTFADFEVSE